MPAYKEYFLEKLKGIKDKRELENIWRVLYEDIFRSSDYSRLDDIIELLKKDVPVQYITGMEYFYGNKFHGQ